jgi:predicted methyltransferase
VVSLGFWLAAAAAATTAAQGNAASAGPQQPSRHGRLYEPRDLALLESPDRDIWQKPDRIMDALGIADGSVVADLGAGGGWFTIRLARRVGPNGIVYAEDIQRLMIEATERRVGREGLRNVRTRLGTAEDPDLPRNSMDAILIVDTYQIGRAHV